MLELRRFSRAEKTCEKTCEKRAQMGHKNLCAIKAQEIRGMCCKYGDDSYAVKAERYNASISKQLDLIGFVIENKQLIARAISFSAAPAQARVV